jgi:hypothetical protein
LNAVAVRGDVSRSNGTKARKKKQAFRRKRLMKVEKSCFFALLFFCFGKKSKRRNNRGFHFLASPQKTKQKRSSAGKIQLPTFSLLLKFPKLVVVPPPQTAGNFDATSSCGFPV